MNISLSKQELVMLLRMANIGDWVMFADLDGDDSNALAHQKALQKLFSAAHKAKMDTLVHYEPKQKKYSDTKEFEVDYQGFIDEFNESQFWTTLADRLAVRDLVEQVGEKVFDAMEWVERGGKLDGLSCSYEQEFVKNGLQRLHLLNTLNKGNA